MIFLKFWGQRPRPDMLAEMTLNLGVFIACWVTQACTSSGKSADGHILSGEQARQLVCVDRLLLKFLLKLSATPSPSPPPPAESWHKLFHRQQSLHYPLEQPRTVAALKIKLFPSSFWNMQRQHWIKMANVFKKTEIMLPFKRMDVCSILFPCLTWKIGLRRCQLTAKSQFLRNAGSRAQGEEVKSLLNLKLTKFEYSHVVTSLWTKDWGEKPSVSRSRGPVSALFTGQVVFQSHNNPAKSYCLDFTNGERTPERTEVIFFKTLAPRWGNDGHFYYQHILWWKQTRD